MFAGSHDVNMPTNTPDFDIGFSTEGERLALVGEDFCDEVRALGINLATEIRPSGIKASLDWVIPTAVAVFIAHKYFGTLLEEAAKDDYPRLKAAFVKLAKRTTGNRREVKLTVISAGKTLDPDPDVFSVWVSLRHSRNVVSKFHHLMSSDDCDIAVESLFELLKAYALNANEADVLSQAPSALSSSQWAPVVMRFNIVEKRWDVWVLDRSGQGKVWER